MNVREAILKAAERIDASPNDFEFSSGVKPKCGTPGCALGWIGFYAEIGDGDFYYPEHVARAIDPLMDELDFYKRMGRLCADGIGRYESQWMHVASKCATTLRAFADRYFPASTPTPSEQP